MTDWPAIVAAIEATGLRRIDIANAIGRSERYVGLLRSGKISDPAHSVGQALLSLLPVDTHRSEVYFSAKSQSGV